MGNILNRGLIFLVIAAGCALMGGLLAADLGGPSNVGFIIGGALGMTGAAIALWNARDD